MDRQRKEQMAVGLPTSPYVTRFAHRREAGVGQRQMPRRDRPRYPGRRAGDPRSPWRGVAMLGIVLALAIVAWLALSYA